MHNVSKVSFKTIFVSFVNYKQSVAVPSVCLRLALQSRGVMIFPPRFACLRRCFLPAFAVKRLSDFSALQKQQLQASHLALFSLAVFFFPLKAEQRETFCPQCVAAGTSQCWSPELARLLHFGKPESCQGAFQGAFCLHSWTKNTATVMFPPVWYCKLRNITSIDLSIYLFFFIWNFGSMLHQQLWHWQCGWCWHGILAKGRTNT